MDIIRRNFYRKLCMGAFREKLELEPMSAYKWKKLNAMAEEKEVLCYVDETVMPHKFQPELQDMPNFILNHRLEKIRYREQHAIDASGDTLALLNIILFNTNQILTRGLHLRGIIELGIFLRKRGHKVDYVKLETWLQKLYLQPMVRMQCSYLIEHFHFTPDELPFVNKEITVPSKLTLGALHFLHICSRRLSEIEE